jgi:hypothetical protein
MISMLPHRTAHGPPWSERVRGLGVCDALQLRLEPAQLPALLDEIEARRTAHEEALEAALATSTGVESARRRAEAREDRERHRRSLELLQAVRDQLPPAGSGAAFFVTGPASLISALVEGAARDAAEAPLAVANAGGTLSRDAAAQLRDAAQVAGAWAETLAAVRELEWFTFETS